MKDRALILAPFSEPELEALREVTHVTYESWFDSLHIYDPRALASRLQQEGISILVVESDFIFEEVFEIARGLKFVGLCRSSISNVDVEAATRHRVLIVNTPTRNTQGVAEHAIGFMICLARRIPMTDQYVRTGQWQNPVEPYMSMRGVELGGRTLGVIGFGNIGRRLTQIARALRMKILTYDPFVESVPEDVMLVDLDTLMSNSDFVSVHVPYSDQSKGLVDNRRIELMKPTAYIVNLSAASIIDEDALVSALLQKRIAGAAMDVFETQPIAPDSRLLSLDNIILTPHLGGATIETIKRHSEDMAADIQRYLIKQRPKNLVNPEVWDQNG